MNRGHDTTPTIKDGCVRFSTTNTGAMITMTTEQYDKLPTTHWRATNKYGAQYVESSKAVEGRRLGLSPFLFGPAFSDYKRHHLDGDWLNFLPDNVRWETRHGAARRSLIRREGREAASRLYTFDELSHARSVTGDYVHRRINTKRAKKPTEAPAAPAVTPTKINRNCLKCDHSFRSNGPHNRLCPMCADSNRHTSEDMTYSIRGAHETKKSKHR